MKVIFFGKFADTIASAIDVEVTGPCSVASLRAQLNRTFPEAGLMDRRVRTCVEGTIVGDDTPLSGTQPVEILAPVSGG